MVGGDRVESRFDAVMDALEAGVVIHAADTSILEANARARDFLGITDLEGRMATDPAWQFLEVDLTPMTLERFPVMQVLATGGPLRDFAMVVRPPSGADLRFEVSAAPVIDAEGTLIEVVVTFIDVTERANYETAILAGSRQLAETERIAHVGHWSLDLATGYVEWSPALYAMFGLEPSIAPNFRMQESLFTPDSCERLQAAVRRTQSTGEGYALDLQVIRADGSLGWVDARGEAVRDSSGAVVGLRGISLDVSERKAASEALRALATRDGLTDLANRAALVDELTRHLRRARRSASVVAIMLMDLDHFKDVNDTFGHAAGDELLVAAADRLLATVRGGDLVARLGGDEFVIVMPGIRDPDEAKQVADRIVTAFRAPFILRSGEVFSTASLGVAFGDGSGEAGDVLREADTAMYAAKSGGRDRFAEFDERLRTAASTRLGIETDLRRALERDQLDLWFQPEVDLATGAVVGLEALLRWHHPSGSLWSADRFMSTAEESGLILEIGPWVLTQACTRAAGWANEWGAGPIVVRVNVSAIQLAEARLLDDLDKALETSGLDPALLCVEITETALLHHTSTVAANLRGLRERGVSIAIDDFGTGYASLTNLHLYPIDLLKIDRSFVSDPAAQHDHQLVRGIVALASTLGIEVTAEGVETHDQVGPLVAMGCTTAQGFLFSKAVPADEVPALLRHRFAVDASAATP